MVARVSKDPKIGKARETKDPQMRKDRESKDPHIWKARENIFIKNMMTFYRGMEKKKVKQSQYKFLKIG